MAVTRAEKEQELHDLEAAFKASDTAILVDYKGLNVPQVTELRRQLRGAKASYKVVKNTLARRASKGTRLASLEAKFEGTTAIAYTGDDAVALAKALTAFMKTAPALKIKAAVLQVPFVDVLTTMLDASLPLTVGEYLEWGNPNEERFYRSMRSYSPYDNLKTRSYPAMLVETSLNDSQVMYWEPAKYVAKLRTLRNDRNPLLLKTIMEAGHGGASGRYDALKELSFTYTFVLDQLGLAR